MTPTELGSSTDTIPTPPPVKAEVPTLEPTARAVLQQEAWGAFCAALPELLREHNNEWVVYYGAELLLFAPTQALAYQAAATNGHSAHDVLVMCVYPGATDVHVGHDLYRDGIA